MIDVLRLENPRDNVMQTATLSKMTGTMGARHGLGRYVIICVGVC